MTLILRYKRLQPEAIERIFQANIKRLREAENQLHEVSGEPPIFIMERDLMRFAADHCAKHPNGKGAWNGREIRNAFVMAASLARHDATGTDDPAFQPQLRYNHFQEVEVLTEEYNRFRVQLFGGDDSRRALLSEERNDEFENEEEREEVKRAATISQLDFARMVYASSSQTAREPFPDMRAAAQASAGLKVFSQVPRPSPPWTGASTGPSAFGRHATMQGGPEADSTEQSHFSSQGGAR
jgi:hypothetical protein